MTKTLTWREKATFKFGSTLVTQNKFYLLDEIILCNATQIGLDVFIVFGPSNFFVVGCSLNGPGARVSKARIPAVCKEEKNLVRVPLYKFPNFSLLKFSQYFYNVWQNDNGNPPKFGNSRTALIRPVVPGCAGCAKYFADQLTLFQPGGTDYAHLITTGIPRFSDLPTALYGQDR